jgi:hypothetical protein
MGVACSTHGTDGIANKLLIGKPEGKRPLGTSRYILEDNMKTDIKIGCECVEWINLSQDRDGRFF